MVLTPHFELPKLIAPMIGTLTLKPDLPSLRYSTCGLFSDDDMMVVGSKRKAWWGAKQRPRRSGHFYLRISNQSHDRLIAFGTIGREDRPVPELTNAMMSSNGTPSVFLEA